MIKITTELKNNQGFSTKVGVLEVTTYTVNETVQVAAIATPAIPPYTAGKNIMINVAVYKSLADKEAGEAAMQPKGFPYNFNVKPAAEDIINEAYIYSKVLAELINQGYTASLV